jgi:hypothetical protein
MSVMSRLGGQVPQRALTLLLCIFASTPAMAGRFSTDGVLLEIPAGFIGPIAQSDKGAKLFGFTKESAIPNARTLLQVTTLDPGNNAIPATLTKQELAAGAEKYVLELLQGVEQRRTEFKRGKIVHLSLAGIPAVKVAWQGKAQEIGANGVMYCVLVKGKIISFHAQDAGNKVTPNMREAIKAIEGMTIK